MKKLLLVLMFTMIASGVIACSGPNVWAVIAENEFYSKIFFMVSIVIGQIVLVLQSMFNVYKSKFINPLTMLLVYILHPFIWFNGGGDCGDGMFNFSKWFTIFLGVFLLQTCYISFKRYSEPKDETE